MNACFIGKLRNQNIVSNCVNEVLQAAGNCRFRKMLPIDNQHRTLNSVKGAVAQHMMLNDCSIDKLRIKEYDYNQQLIRIDHHLCLASTRINDASGISDDCEVCYLSK
jgi:hypothetical protein